MNASMLPRHAVIDDFLPDDSAQALLDHALANKPLFEPASVRDGGAYRIDQVHRLAYATPDLGPARCAFTAAVDAHADRLCRAVGLEPFPVAAWDIEMAAHRDGGHFHDHIDTMTAGNRVARLGDRVISLVYYLHRSPPGFTGGELAIRPFIGDAEGVRIAPRHNRLVAFPSFARHAVEETRVPGDAWDDARFSINCWLLRASAP